MPTSAAARPVAECTSGELGFSVIQVSIRFEQPRDGAEVHTVNEQAFGRPQEAQLVDALRALPDSLSLVATAGDRVIGHILFTPVTLEPPRAGLHVAGLAPMAVQPGFQRQGIGSQLVRGGLEACRRQGYTAVVVVGHPKYYPRFGFVPAHTQGLEYEHPVPREAFMVIELDSGTLAGYSGVVRYRPEFDAFE